MAHERFGVLQPSGAFRRPVNDRKRRRPGVLQDAHASLHPLVFANPWKTRIEPIELDTHATPIPAHAGESAPSLLAGRGRC